MENAAHNTILEGAIQTCALAFIITGRA